jgi:cytochrome P450
LRIYTATMTEHILRMSNRWEDNGTIDVHKEFMQLTLAIVCKLLFNFDIESEAKETCHDSCRVFQSCQDAVSSSYREITSTEQQTLSLR